MRHRNLFLALAFFGLSAMTNAQLVDSGTCGDGVTWEITGVAPDYTLTISWDGVGTGLMDNYNVYFGIDPPYYAYRNDMTTLIIEEGITHIGEFAFHPFTSFKGTLLIPNSVASVGDWAFRDCSGFTNLIICSSVSIKTFAFYGCGLTQITCLATTPPSFLSGAFPFYNVSSTIPVYVPCGSVSSYQSAWSNAINTGVGFTTYVCGYKLEVLSNDPVLGSGNNPTTTISVSATLYAIPKPNAVFSQWNDGNTENPRYVTLTGDITFTAYFAENPMVAQITTLVEEIANLQNDLTDCNDANADLQNDLTDCNNANANLQNDLSDCNDANANLQNDLTDCNNANDILQDQITTLTDELSDCNDANANLQNDLDDCNSANDTLQEQITTLTDELSDCNDANANLQNDLTDCNNTNDSLQEQITTLTDELSDCNDANANLQNDLTDCNNENDSLQDQITTLTDELSDCNDENEVLQGYLEECETERDNLQQLLDDCLSGIDSESMRSGLIIYPNPVSSDGVLYIANETLQKGDKIEIFDMSGRLLSISYAQGSETFIHIGVLPQGTYLLRLAGQKGVRFEVR